MWNERCEDDVDKLLCAYKFYKKQRDKKVVCNE